MLKQLKTTIKQTLWIPVNFLKPVRIQPGIFQWEPRKLATSLPLFRFCDLKKLKTFHVLSTHTYMNAGLPQIKL